MLIEMVIGLLALMGVLYLYLTRNYDYWKKKGVVFIEPKFPLGTIHDQFTGKADAGTTFLKWYTQYKKQGLKFVGSYSTTQPTMIVLDLDLCKHVMTKDFNHFVTRGMIPSSHEYITKHLFSLNGKEWKDMRTTLTPTFTSGKMKNMYTLMEKCAEQLQEHIDEVVLKEGVFPVKDLIVRFTTDIIATCAFGLEVNSIKDTDNEFYKTGKLIFVPRRSVLLKVFLYKNFPTIAKFFKLNFLEPRISEVLSKVIKDTVEYRKQNNVTRNDFVDLLLKTKDQADNGNSDDEVKMNGSQHASNKGKDGLTLEQMTAQSFAFFAAGFETAGSTTSFCLYELAKNEEVQTKLRREIDEVLENHGGKLTYQALQEMTYMDQVMNETLRRYASLPILVRECSERYQVPGTDLVLEEGIRVNIPAYAFHHDPEIYPDPYRFDPDRFSEENSKDRHHYAFIPFGEGPRNCIGMRFGKLQVKVGLVAILSKYELSTAPDTPSRLELNPFILLTTPKKPFSLKISRRSDL